MSSNRRKLMAEVSAISWTDATFNPWIGCTKVSPACDHCYAERDNSRRKWVEGWGAGVPRHRTKTWGDPIKWDKSAALSGARPRVFCASLADVFDNEVPQEWREDLFMLIRHTPNLRWILLTKRIGNAAKMLPSYFPDHFPHVGIMSTLENQEVWDRDYPKLARIPAAWRGVSAEPLLSHIDIGDARPDWIITGGESGRGFRPLDMDAVRSLRDQCAAAGIAFHHKQNGGITGKVAGCLVDGIEHKNFPPALAACK
jgi:protein gp37